MQEPAKNKKTDLRIALLKTLGIVVLAFALSFILAQPFSISTATLISSNDRNDFEIPDFYNIVANSRNVRTLDPDIVIVSIDQSDRDDIAEIIEMLSLCQPAAIGVDATFDEARGGMLDDRLLQVLTQTPNLVLATTTVRDSAGAFSYGEQSFFQQEMPQLTYASVTLPNKFAKGTVRNFPVAFTMADSAQVLSFAAALAKEFDSDAYNRLRSRGRDNEIINYPSREYRKYTPQQIADHADEFYGKVVLLGALDERSDEHATPIDPTMSGVEIHAHALSTILSGEYLSRLSSKQNWAIAIALCALFAFLCVTISVGVKGMILRILQVLMLYLIVRCGYYFFTSHNLVIDFSYSFLMITFGLFAADIWIGCTNMGKWAVNKIKRK